MADGRFESSMLTLAVVYKPSPSLRFENRAKISLFRRNETRWRFGGFLGANLTRQKMTVWQCDQIGRNFAIWANFFCLGRNFFQEFIYYWAIFWAKFYLLWANFFPSLFTIGRIFSEIWANFFSNRLVTLFQSRASTKPARGQIQLE